MDLEEDCYYHIQLSYPIVIF